MQNKHFFVLLLSLFSVVSLNAQLDSIHWLPPMFARVEFGPQFIYLSTPSPTPFPVTIRNGAGQIVDMVVISNAQPARYSIGTTGSTAILVPQDSLFLPLKTRGYILDAPDKFYANFRTHSSSENQAGDLTCKGRGALGKVFRIGHMFQSVASNAARGNFIGIMATEDSTTVTLSDFNPEISLTKSDGTLYNGSSGPVSIDLKKGETLLFAQYISTNAFNEPPNGLIGALLESTKPIVVNCGSWLGAPQEGSNDIGIDQIAPFEQMGKEYILCKGNGSNDMETPIIVAHVNNTMVWINGSNTPIVTLNAGDFIRLTNNYSAANNMYIRTSEPVFVYQIIGGVPSGNDIYRTGGLTFVPPISCAIPNKVDNIYFPNKIGDIVYDGGLMIVAMKDSTVTLRIDGNVVPLGTPDAVPGNPDFVTYRRLTLFSSSTPVNTTSVIANGAIQVAMFGRNGAAGFGAFYSGFSKLAQPDLTLLSVSNQDGVCPDTLIATGRFDGIQWYYRDSLIYTGTDTTLITFAPGQYIARAFLGVCTRTDFVQDTIDIAFQSPEFEYELKEPSCYAFRDGQVIFGTPSGGMEPYEYSINSGASFASNQVFTGLPKGEYTLVARDVTGCYNRPIDVSIGQPDSITVSLEVVQLPDPLKPGEQVTLLATADHTVETYAWMPNDTVCRECDRLAVFPQQTTTYIVVTTNDKGCTATDRVLVVVEPNVYAPNVITPAAADGNTIFALFSKEDLQVTYLRVYDRWGGQVFESTNTRTNDLSSGWDGSFKNKDLPPGVYVYTAEIRLENGRSIYLKGDITLIW